MTAPSPAIEVKDLVFEYPTVRALHGVSIRVARNSITALVGPNGAGKTTLLRCIAGLEQPYTGSAWVDGINVAENPRKVHAHLGFLADFFGLYDDLTVRQCLTYAARAHGLPPAKADIAAADTSKLVGLSDRLETRAGELSRGLRQRLAIGQALVHSPPVLLLDEPASGLDPDARRELSSLLRTLKAEGITQIVSSHILAELEDYSDDMIVMEKGRVKGHIGRDATDAVETVRIRLEFAIDPSGFDGFANEAGARLVEHDGLSAVIELGKDAETRAQFLKDAIERGFAVSAFMPYTRTLEDAYFDEVHRGNRGKI